MENKIITISIIGVGARGAEAYGRYIHASKDKFKIVSICDVNEYRLEKYGKAFEIPQEERFIDEEEFFTKKRSDVLLIANDRNAMKGEHSVIMVNDNILVTKRAIEEGVVKYYGLMDNRYRLIEHDGIQVVGYVAKTIKEK